MSVTNVSAIEVVGSQNNIKVKCIASVWGGPATERFWDVASA